MFLLHFKRIKYYLTTRGCATFVKATNQQNKSISNNKVVIE